MAPHESLPALLERHSHLTTGLTALAVQADSIAFCLTAWALLAIWMTGSRAQVPTQHLPVALLQARLMDAHSVLQELDVTDGLNATTAAASAI